VWANYAKFLESTSGLKTEVELYYDKAQQYFENEVSKHHQDAYDWSMLAKIYARKPDEKVRAEMAFRKAVEIEPKQPTLWENLTDFLIGEERWQGVSRAISSCPERDSRGCTRYRSQN
jgi:Tfp pilus assembly protein PilF